MSGGDWIGQYGVPVVDFRRSVRPAPFNRDVLFGQGRFRPAFTLIELVTSMAVVSVLFLALGSSIVVASRAIPTEQNASNDIIQSSDVLDGLVDELRTAVQFIGGRATRLVFTIGDRSGDGGPERIRYEWSGTPGAPLTRSYNGGFATVVIENVQEFDLAFDLQPRRRNPRVLLVVPNAQDLSGQDEAKRDTIESWGYSVTLIDASSSQNVYRTAAVTAEVAYISEEIRSNDVNTKLKPMRIGVINEERYLHNDLGIASVRGLTYGDNKIEITDDSHEITSVFGTGSLDICEDDEPLVRTSRALAAGAQVLAVRPSEDDATLVVVEAGAALHGRNSAAAGRRVLLPWGGNSFDFNELTQDGRMLMQRCIDWAAPPKVLAGVGITLRTGQDGTTRTQTRIELLNLPGAFVP